ncbi:MAG TPA: phage Gp37/Gp68 family protein [Solirubrobacteraceae bacterium]
MPGPTSIEWATSTWNPSTGCAEVSPGCAHCYAKTFAERWRGIPGHPYEQGFDLRLWPERLSLPLRWRKPSVIFVNSMSDLFHEEIPDEFVDRVFAVMAWASWHTFQVLTKRPERMRDYLTDPGVVDRIDRAMCAACCSEVAPGACGFPGDDCGLFGCEFPLANVWVGVSIENRRFVHRADLVRQTPAAVRFISAEPLLGPLVDRPACPDCGGTGLLELGACDACEGFGRYRTEYDLDLTEIDWLIVGGESGPRSRPMDLEWVDALAGAAREQGTALFVKQLGARWARARHSSSIKGGDPGDWPERLRVREMPRATGGETRGVLAERAGS